MNLVIDTDDYVASGIEVFTFPGGEWHTNVPAWPYRSVNIFAKLRTWADVGPFLAVVDALDSQGVAVHVFSPYCPGLQQDRNPDGLTPLTSRIFGRLFAQASSVTVADPHSVTGFEHFRRGTGNHKVKILDPALYLPKLLTAKYTHLIVPDDGAVERSKLVAKILGIPNLVQSHKHRDFQTGRLSGFSLDDGLSSDHVNTMPRDSRILLADDVCVGGGTFLGVLNVLRKINYEVPCDLFVTHGVFSAGFENLLGGSHPFHNIYTTNSWYNPANTETAPHPGLAHRIHSIDLLPFYLGGLTP